MTMKLCPNCVISLPADMIGKEEHGVCVLDKDWTKNVLKVCDDHKFPNREQEAVAESGLFSSPRKNPEEVIRMRASTVSVGGIVLLVTGAAILIIGSIMAGVMIGMGITGGIQ